MEYGPPLSSSLMKSQGMTEVLRRRLKLLSLHLFPNTQQCPLKTQKVMTPEENNLTPNPKSCLVWHNSIFIKTSRRLSHRLQQWAPARWQLLSRLRCDNRQQKYVHNTTGCVQEMTIKLLAQKLSFTHNLPPWQEPLRWSSISSSLCLQLHLEKVHTTKHALTHTQRN